MAATRRAAPLFSVLLLGAAAAWVFARLAFVPGMAPWPAARTRGRTAVRGFKEDFLAWRASLTPEERKLKLAQAKGEFNKKFRKSADFDKPIRLEKEEELNDIIKKFFENESEDYKKEQDAKVPDFEGLTRRASLREMDMSLKHRIIHVDRKAGRRYQYASAKIQEAEEKGELFPPSSPYTEKHAVANSDAESHANNLKVLDMMKLYLESPDTPEEAKEDMKKWIEKGIPAQGENFFLALPKVLVDQIHQMQYSLHGIVKNSTSFETEADREEYRKEVAEPAFRQAVRTLTEKYVNARDDVEKDVITVRDWYRSMEVVEGQTKADVLQSIWASMAEITGKSLPPIDEQIIEDLKQYPALAPGEANHIWGTHDVVYKSEAIDPFGAVYLLGVFATKEECTKAFDQWNEEYIAARARQQEDIAQWAKNEEAKLATQKKDMDKLTAIMEEAKR